MALLTLPGLFVDSFTEVREAPRPALINRNPGPDEDGVPIDTSIAIEVVKKLNYKFAMGA